MVQTPGIAKNIIIPFSCTCGLCFLYKKASLCISPVSACSLWSPLLKVETYLSNTLLNYLQLHKEKERNAMGGCFSVQNEHDNPVDDQHQQPGAVPVTLRQSIYDFFKEVHFIFWFPVLFYLLLNLFPVLAFSCQEYMKQGVHFSNWIRENVNFSVHSLHWRIWRGTPSVPHLFSIFCSYSFDFFFYFSFSVFS